MIEASKEDTAAVLSVKRDLKIVLADHSCFCDAGSAAAADDANQSSSSSTSECGM
jgi:hypothetical protein